MISAGLRGAADDALEATVVFSFSRVGFDLRQRIYNWAPFGERTLEGKTALITGPTSGVGRAAALGLARLGARTVLVGRDPRKLADLETELTALSGRAHHSVVADMSSLASVNRAVNWILGSETRLDVLVDNAGAIYPERQQTDEGLERTMAILVCGPFALETGLLPLLESTPESRVIAITSGGMYTQRVHFDDLQWRSRPYNGSVAYAQAKRIQVALIREWARRFRSSGISFDAMHPGWADTPGLAEALPTFRRVMRPLLRTPEQAADTILWLATTTSIRPPGGQLYLDRRSRLFDRIPQTRLSADDRAELWDTISELTSMNPCA